MLNDFTVVAMVAVSDNDKSKSFYQDKLGLNAIDENPGGVMYQCGGGKMFVYQSEQAGTNKATAVNWDVVNIEAVVSELKSKGFEFEIYDMYGVTVKGEIHIMGPFKNAWFKDPDGNILGLTEVSQES